MSQAVHTFGGSTGGECQSFCVSVCGLPDTETPRQGEEGE